MKPLFTDSEWSIEKIEKTWKAINKIATEKFGLDYYPVQIELITAEQMLNNYSSNALPIMYSHWSFGKSFVQNERSYNKGITGLAYEVVINTNPCIAYLMESNSMTMQTLVMAHACCGHNFFFKNNYLFKKWTDAESIVDYMKFARNYIKDCEYKYGEDHVELFLDACHSIKNNSINKYKKPSKRKSQTIERKKEWLKYNEESFTDMWRTLPRSRTSQETTEQEEPKYELPEENLLYFIETYSDTLKPWQREICRIVRTLAQYFYPQMQTQLCNEGCATFWHYHIMTELYEQGLITDGSYLEFLESHTGVTYQPQWTSNRYGGINVYALGFAMFQDIKRICEKPTEEDRYWFPDICDTNWVETIKDIQKNYRDEGFILQYLSPKVIRDFKLFTATHKEQDTYYTVSATHSDEDILKVRKDLAEAYDVNQRIPRIEVTDVDSDGWLILSHYSENRLHYEEAKKTAMYIYALWGKRIKIEYKNLKGEDVDEI